MVYNISVRQSKGPKDPKLHLQKEKGKGEIEMENTNRRNANVNSTSRGNGKRKLIAAAIAVVLFGCALTACTARPAPDLTGSWIATSGGSGNKMSAEISATTIDVYWSAEETRALYWSGTYDAPTKAGAYTWTSINDHDKTRMALLASNDDTKDFTYDDGEITFDVTALGITKTVHLVKAGD